MQVVNQYQFDRLYFKLDGFYQSKKGKYLPIVIYTSLRCFAQVVVLSINAFRHILIYHPIYVDQRIYTYIYIIMYIYIYSFIFILDKLHTLYQLHLVK